MPCRSGRYRARGSRSRFARVYNMRSGKMEKVRIGDRPIRVYSVRKHDVVVIKARDYRKFRKAEEKAKRKV